MTANVHGYRILLGTWNFNMKTTGFFNKFIWCNPSSEEFVLLFMYKDSLLSLCWRLEAQNIQTGHNTSDQCYLQDQFTQNHAAFGVTSCIICTVTNRVFELMGAVHWNIQIMQKQLVHRHMQPFPRGPSSEIEIAHALSHQKSIIIAVAPSKESFKQHSTV